MTRPLTIGQVSRQSGLNVRTIRFYEAAGVIPAPGRTSAGYRIYSRLDLRRLKLARQARLLGLDLGEVRDLVGRAFASDCATFAAELLAGIARQRRVVRERIRELQALETSFRELELHVQHAECATRDETPATCSFCFEGDTETAQSAASARGRENTDDDP